MRLYGDKNYSTEFFAGYGFGGFGGDGDELTTLDDEDEEEVSNINDEILELLIILSREMNTGRENIKNMSFYVIEHHSKALKNIYERAEQQREQARGQTRLKRRK